MQGVTDWLVKIGFWGSMLLPVMIVFGVWGGLLWVGLRRRRLRMKRAEAEGKLGPASFFQSDMPIHYNFVAQIGTSGPAEMTVGEKLLRPSIGVKLVVLGVSAMIVYYATLPAFWPAELAEPDPGTGWIFSAARILLPLAVIYGVLYIFTSEARYDHKVLIVTRFLQRREYRWTFLTRIADGGAYDLVLFFKPGGRVKVLKHSVGIREFKDFALEQVRKNGKTNA